MSREQMRFLAECAVVGFSVGWALAATKENRELRHSAYMLMETSKILIRHADPAALDLALEEVEILQEFDKIMDQT